MATNNDYINSFGRSTGLLVQSGSWRLGTPVLAGPEVQPRQKPSGERGRTHAGHRHPPGPAAPGLCENFSAFLPAHHFLLSFPLSAAAVAAAARCRPLPVLQPALPVGPRHSSAGTAPPGPSHSPQRADEPIDRALRVQGHDVPDVQKAGHFLTHFGSFFAGFLTPPLKKKLKEIKIKQTKTDPDADGARSRRALSAAPVALQDGCRGGT